MLFAVVWVVPLSGMIVSTCTWSDRLKLLSKCQVKGCILRIPRLTPRQCLTIPSPICGGPILHPLAREHRTVLGYSSRDARLVLAGQNLDDGWTSKCLFVLCRDSHLYDCTTEAVTCMLLWMGTSIIVIENLPVTAQSFTILPIFYQNLKSTGSG